MSYLMENPYLIKDYPEEQKEIIANLLNKIYMELPLFLNADEKFTYYKYASKIKKRETNIK